jgi:hypothetical protein
MLALLVLLIVTYLRLEIGRSRAPLAETWLIRLPVSVYLGWITVATIANITALLYYLRWDGLGIAPEAWTAIMLLAATGIASAVSLTRGDIAFMLVIVWAFVGIAVKHAGVPVVTIAAWVATALVAVMLVVGVLLHRRRDLAPAAAS